MSYNDAMYRYYVTKRSPVSCWILDDGPTFADCTGNGGLAEVVTGSPSTTTPLVCGAPSSTVVDRDNTIRFGNRLFKQGLESRKFALEAWVLPMPQTYGNDQEYVNLYDNPSFETGVGRWVESGGADVPVVSTAQAWVGDQSLHCVKGAGTSFVYAQDTGVAALLTEGPGDYTATVVAWVPSSDVSTAAGVRWGGAGVAKDTSVLTDLRDQWVELTHTFTWDGTGGVTLYAHGNDPTSEIYIDGIHIVPGTTPPANYLDGDTIGAEWSGAPHASASTMLLSHSAQRILSNLGLYDGITIDGTKINFSTEYTTAGTAACSYDLQENKLAHVVGIHSDDANELWVNGERVATVALTDEQRSDSYLASDDYLYCGGTDSSHRVAVSAVAAYPTMSAEDIFRNYSAGLLGLPYEKIYPQYSGTAVTLGTEALDVVMRETWDSGDDFSDGVSNSVAESTDKLLPTYASGVSVSGDWTIAVPLDLSEDTSIYGAYVEWRGVGFTVETSLDGSSWSAQELGGLVAGIPNGFDPTGVDLYIRVSFPSGLLEEEEHALSSLSLTVLRTGAIGVDSERAAAVVYPAVPRGEGPPNRFSDSHALDLRGGALIVSPDFTIEDGDVRTVEFWIKPRSAQPLFSTDGTMYVNGELASTIPVGEWSLVHIVGDVNFNNMHADPSFDSSDSGYSALTGATTSLDTSLSYSEPQSLKAVADGTGAANGHSGTLYMIPDVVNGQAHGRVMAYKQGTNASDNAKIRIGGGGVDSANSVSPTVRDEWVPIELSVDISATGGSVLMYLYADNANGDTTWFDDIQTGIDIVVEGDCIIGSATLYPEQLSSNDVQDIWKLYTGRSVVRVSDGIITFSEDAAPAKTYSSDWAIDSAG